MQLQAQLFPAQALQVGVLAMIGRQLAEEVRGEATPALRRNGDAGCAGLESDQPRSRGQSVGLGRRQDMVAGERCQVGGEGRGVQQSREGLGGIGQGERGELPAPLGRAPPPGRAAQIDEATATDRAPGGNVAQHETVLQGGGDRPLEHQLDVALLAGFDWGVAEWDDTRADLGRGVMQPDREPLAYGLGLAT
ncbi:MAG TPA: hypothetical protein VFE10_05405 [Phenylobacterium sp.]|nr:hypothetical protein [Phenylobacterium sp.]